MINPEFSSLPIQDVETANFIIGQSMELDGRVHQRVLLQAANIPVRNVPIGGRENTDQLLSFMSLASHGFAISLRAAQTTPEEFPALSRFVGDLRDNELDDIWREIESLGIPVPPQLASPNEQQLLASSGHAIATLARLSEHGSVTYSALGLKKRAPDKPTYWRRRWSPIDIFRLFGEIRQTTERLIADPKPIEEEDMPTVYRTAHFHAAGSQVAQGLLKNLL